MFFFLSMNLSKVCNTYLVGNGAPLFSVCSILGCKININIGTPGPDCIIKFVVFVFLFGEFSNTFSCTDLPC